MGYGPMSMVVDIFSGLYSWLLSLCCAVSCAVGSGTLTLNSRTLRTVKLLAEGGFSFVYLVEDGSNKEKLALKKVLSQLPEQSELARREIEVHSAFSHPNVMPLIDHAVVPAANGAESFLLLMPLYPHGTLLDAALAHQAAGTRMSETEALRMFQQLLSGVLCFHNHDPAWAHRDIKPANVLVGEGDVPVLMDFGSVAPARRKISSRTEALLMQEDAAMNCSMPYRAPELFDLPSDGAIDERTDVFSLGATLYAMVFYYSPFECTFQVSFGLFWPLLASFGLFWSLLASFGLLWSVCGGGLSPCHSHGPMALPIRCPPTPPPFPGLGSKGGRVLAPARDWGRAVPERRAVLGRVCRLYRIDARGRSAQTAIRAAAHREMRGAPQEEARCGLKVAV